MIANRYFIIYLQVLLLVVSMPAVGQHKNVFPDSLLTEDYIYEYTFSDFEKAVKIAGTMRERKLLPVHRLDIAEGDLYFNTGKYNRALVYYRRALISDSVRNNNAVYMDQLHRMISSYDCLHNEKEKAKCVQMLLEKAQACKDTPMESIALFNMGKMLYYQEDKARGYKLIDKAIELMKHSNYKHKYDNLRYNYNSLLIMQQRDNNYVDALVTLDELEKIVLKNIQEETDIKGLAEKEKKTMYAQRALVLLKLGRLKQAEEAYQQWRTIGRVYTKDDYLITPYLMDLKRYDEVIRIQGLREQFLREQKDTINYHMRATKRSLGKAYEAKGNFRKAANYLEEFAILTDSLKIREQKSLAIELATVYETNEKEMQLQQQNADLRLRNVLLFSAGGAILLLLLLLWRFVYYSRIVRRKNVAMVETIEELLKFKDELEVKKNEISVLKDRREIVPEVIIDTVETSVNNIVNFDCPDEDQQEENKLLFEQLEKVIVSEQLFLNPHLSRDDLMKQIGVDKNRFGQIMRQCTRNNVTTYINNKRLEYAVRLLSKYPDYTITTIAQSCGIPNTPTFNRLFKEKFEMTPTDFKNSLSFSKRL